MKKFILAIFLSAAAVTSAYSQSSGEAKPTQPKTITISEVQKAPTAPVKTEKRGPMFRPTKDQIKQVQAMLKGKTLYTGEATGSYNDETRTAIKTFQKENGLKQTGTLNRATLEKMGIELTDSQKEIPVSESSYAASEEPKAAKAEMSGPSAAAEPKPKKPAVFRATADQIKEAQRALKSKSLYVGEETGKLDDATRAGLKKYQEANSLKPTGTLNQATLESMGIALTDKQKGSAENQK
jgi:peptidoglycan hydrolase-like protein with peptidoglycan-binding domain